MNLSHDWVGGEEEWTAGRHFGFHHEMGGNFYSPFCYYHTIVVLALAGIQFNKLLTTRGTGGKRGGGRESRVRGSVLSKYVLRIVP